MNLVGEREKLLSAFQMVSPVVPSRTTHPILQNIKLEADGDHGYLLASDSDISIRVKVDGLQVEEAGSVVLPTSRFGRILRESSDEQLKLKTEEKTTLIKGSRSEFRLPGEDPQEFPTIAPFAETRYHEIPAKNFREMIRRTVFATETESSRFALGGVLIELEEEKVTMVGTDGRRMAVVEGNAQAVGGHRTPEGGNSIIPSRAMSILERLLGDEEGAIQLAIRGNEVVVQTERATFFSNLLEGRFPRWQAVFPKQSEADCADLVVGPFFSAVRQAAIVIGEESHAVYFQFENGSLTLSAEPSQYGESKVELPVAYEGESLSIKLNPVFLTEFLRVLEPDRSLQAELRDPDKAVVFATEDNYRYVVMPYSN
ncbi:DNA polymerase III beta subunit [Planctomycetales bacterium 10988]|nr:DNA polymerase III beta subunit [Planctomycetales bacterium 10988]